MPMDTDPCSNSRMMKVEMTRTFGGAINDAVTSSRMEMMKIMDHPVRIPLRIRGNVILRNTYYGEPPNTLPADSRLVPI